MKRSKAWNLATNKYQEWVLPAASPKEPEERELVVDSGASMHMVVSKKDLNSAELETMRVSKNPTTVMTANGEVHTREERRYMSSNWTCSSKLCFLKKISQYFLWGNSAKNMGTRITGKAVKIHNSSRMARELIAT